MPASRVHDTVAFVRAARSKGVTSAAVAKRFDLSKRTAMARLIAAAKTGAIVRVGRSVSSRWALPGHADALRATLAAEMKRKKAATRSARRACLRAAAEGRPKRRIVPAGVARPLRVRAPRSVFEFSGAAA